MMIQLGQGEKGAVTLETALGFMVVMTCVLGIIECCMMGYTLGVYADAARHGVRYATIHGFDSTNCSGPTSGCGDPTAANVISDVTTYANAYTAPANSVTVAVSYPDAGGCTAASRVQVTIAYVYRPLFHFPGMAQTFHVTSQGRIAY